MYCILNGKITKEENAAIPVNNRSFRYGDGCFETMKVVNGTILLAEFHFERLFHALEKLQFNCPPLFTAAFLSTQIDTLLKKNQHEKMARLRLTVFRGEGGLYDAVNMSPNWLLQSWPLNPETSILNSNGLVTGIYRGGFKAADPLANIKHNNYLLYAMAALHAKAQHWNDALVLNHTGHVADATIANVYIIKNDTIITPPLTEGPVNGVMRRWLLHQLPLHGFAVQERALTENDVLGADEIFLSNAIYGVKWVQQVGEAMFKLNQTAFIHKAIIQPLFQSFS